MQFPTSHVMSFITGRTLVAMNWRDFTEVAVAARGSKINADEIAGLANVSAMVVSNAYNAYIEAFPEYQTDIDYFNSLTKSGVTHEAIDTFMEYAIKKYGDTMEVQVIPEV